MTTYARLPAWTRAFAAHNPGSVLLETARFDATNFKSYFFSDPIRFLIAEDPEAIPQLFSDIEAALSAGFFVAGYFSYESGAHFEPSVRIESVVQGRAGSPGYPLIWLGVYERPHIFDHLHGRFIGKLDGAFTGEFREDSSSSSHPSLPGLAGAAIPSISLTMPVDEYCAKVEKIQSYIAAGDTYQVNFTDSIVFDTQQPASKLFALLSVQQPVSYSAFLNPGGCQILSLSPELFFRVDGDRITTRPMKGTMPRGLDSEEDRVAAVELQNDEKNRSEHVMIVDLLRSDLGRICTMGSVEVEDLFSVERYETLLQMTSKVAGNLRPGISYYEIFRAIFPSGSITGAPKVRTMQIISELESHPRGVYTGAIGFIAPDRSSVFNVAIRTLVMKNGTAALGVGGGIVADSDPMEEYRECRLKASFLTRIKHEFQLIETMLWNGAFPLLALHLQRLKASASYFSFDFDHESIDAHLKELAATLEGEKRYRVRLLLSADGSIGLTPQEFAQGTPSGRIRIASVRTSSTDAFFRHKTTHRALYDEQYDLAKAEGFDDFLFLNEKGEVTEGAISNVFIERSGKMYTPPLSSGVLDGVYRRHLLESRGNIEVTVLTEEDLVSADAIYLCNALRGMYRVQVV